MSVYFLSNLMRTHTDAENEVRTNRMLANITFKNVLEESVRSNTCGCETCRLACNLSGESVSQMVEFAYRPKISRWGDEEDEFVPLFDIKKTVIPILENKQLITGSDLEYSLLVKSGINLMEDELPSIPLYRNSQIPWIDLRYIHLMEPKRPGLEETFQETSEWSEITAESIKETYQYNQIIKHGLRGSFLVKSAQLSQCMTGFFKNPFEEPMNKNVRKFKTVTPNNWLDIEKNNWLKKMNVALPDWSDSLMDESKQSYQAALNLIKKAICDYKTNLRLADEEFWWRDLDEPGVYCHHLKRYADLIQMLAAFTERATDVLLGELKDTAHDLATVLEVLIKSERGYSPEEPVTVKDNVIKENECGICGEDTQATSLYAFKPCYHTYYFCDHCVTNCHVCPNNCPKTKKKKKLYLANIDFGK